MRISSAHVLAVIAIVLALGGNALAFTLGKNSVGSNQLKPNAVTSPKVKDGSLLSSDFKEGQLPEGKQGSEGKRGPEGERGEPGEPAAKIVAYIREGPEPDTKPAEVAFSTDKDLGVEDQGDHTYHVLFNRNVEDCVAFAQAGFARASKVPGGTISTADAQSVPAVDSGQEDASVSFRDMDTGEFVDTSFKIVVFC